MLILRTVGKCHRMSMDRCTTPIEYRSHIDPMSVVDHSTLVEVIEPFVHLGVEHASDQKSTF